MPPTFPPTKPHLKPRSHSPNFGNDGQRCKNLRWSVDTYNVGLPPHTWWHHCYSVQSGTNVNSLHISGDISGTGQEYFELFSRLVHTAGRNTDHPCGVKVLWRRCGSNFLFFTVIPTVWDNVWFTGLAFKIFLLGTTLPNLYKRNVVPYFNKVL